MSIQTVTTRRSLFTPAEQRALRALRTRYQQDSDLFSKRERAQFLFFRWLYQNGYFVETANQP